MIGRLPSSPPRTFSNQRLAYSAERRGGGAGGGRSGRRCGDRAHACTPSSWPGTSGSLPAVIASTTSRCVVSRGVEARDVLAEAQDRDAVGDLEDVVQVVRDEHDREALLGEPAHEVEHLARLRDAERGGRLVEDHEREFHMTAFATATDWRWPPERPATVWRTERIVVTDSELSVSRQRCSIFVSSSA